MTGAAIATDVQAVIDNLGVDVSNPIAADLVRAYAEHVVTEREMASSIQALRDDEVPNVQDLEKFQKMGSIRVSQRHFAEAMT